MTKDFSNWHHLKQDIDTQHKPPLFREREIWWCSIGVNIGYEILGKGNNFTRPVLVIKKYSAFSFLGIPMTSQIQKANYFTYLIDCKGKPSLLLLSQIRTFDARRLNQNIEKIGKECFEEVKKYLVKTIN